MKTTRPRTDSPSIRAAFGKFDYTPAVGGRLGRFAVNILHTTGTLWPLYARMALFDDGDRQMAIVVLDQNVLPAAAVTVLRASIEKSIGLPSGACLVACTHTHNCPPSFTWRPEDDSYALIDNITRKLETLARKLADRLTPVTLKFSRDYAPGWSWNRRTLFRNQELTGVATHGPRGDPGFVRMEGRDESEICTLYAIDNLGNCLGGLVEFSCHPTCMYNEKIWSADYPGAMMEELELKLGGDWVFLPGPSGNLSQLAQAPDVNHPWGMEYCRRMGNTLASIVVDSSKTAESLGAGGIATAREMLVLQQRRVTPEQLRAARDYLENARAGAFTRSLVERLYGYAFHFHPSMHDGGKSIDEWLANEIVGMWEWQRRVAERVPTEIIEVQVLAIADLAFATFPGEMFVEYKDSLRAKSPFRRTVAVQLGNGWHGYVPTLEAFQNGGYECCLAYQSRLEPEAGNKMVECAAKLMTQLHP